MKKKLTIFVLMIATLAIVWHRAAFALSPETNSFCPHISEIQKNPVKGNWMAQTKSGSWRSYDMSFATNITRFVGAQWNGANVGQLTCIYHSNQKFKIEGQPQVQHTLPVLLVFHTLTFQPSQGKWKHVAHGIYNCYSTKRSHCPFKINQKQSIGNIYQEAESLKDKPSNAIQPPSY